MMLRMFLSLFVLIEQRKYNTGCSIIRSGFFEPAAVGCSPFWLLWMVWGCVIILLSITGTNETALALASVWAVTTEILFMRTTPYVYYQEDDMWVGWLEEYPDYRTQGVSLDELEENLRDIQQELESGAIPCVRHTGELVVP